MSDRAIILFGVERNFLIVLVGDYHPVVESGDDIVFIEDQLAVLKKYPFIKVNSKDPTQQKPTPAAKQYKELLQQYNNCIKIFLGVLSTVEKAETSPLREYLNRMKAGINE